MDAQQTPAGDPTGTLPGVIYYQIAHALRAALPPPVTDTQEARAMRDAAAIGLVASLAPATPDEAFLAAQYVAAAAQALDSQRLSHESPDPDRAAKCTAQATSMMRQALAWRRALFATQTNRRIKDADPVAHEAALRTEQAAFARMSEALLHAPPPPAAKASAPPPEPTQPPAPKSDPIAAAEHYALHHRKRATLIRRLRRLPDKTDIGWVPPEVVRVLIHGTTPILQSLDHKPQRFAAAAAAAAAAA